MEKFHKLFCHVFKNIVLDELRYKYIIKSQFRGIKHSSQVVCSSSRFH